MLAFSIKRRCPTDANVFSKMLTKKGDFPLDFLLSQGIRAQGTLQGIRVLQQ